MEQEQGQTGAQIGHHDGKYQPPTKHSQTSATVPSQTTDSSQATTKERIPTMQHCIETQADRCFRFLDLPPELRTIIYHFAFSRLIPSISSLGDVFFFEVTNKVTDFEPLALLQLCKGVRAEVKTEWLRFLRKKGAEIQESKEQAWEEWDQTLDPQAEEVEILVAGGDDRERAELCVEIRWTPECNARDEKLKVADDGKKVVGLLINRSERRMAQNPSQEQVVRQRGSCR